jgi:uncharacterized protein (UPF0179 family)
MLPLLVFTGFTIAIIGGFFYLPVVQGQLNECTIFEGKILVVVRAKIDCLGYADAKMASNGWTIILISNGSIYMDKQVNNSQSFK